MKQWVRWWGLGVFLAIVVLVVGGTYFFADYIVKRTVESVGSNINGAKVELQGAKLSFTPFGFTLADLQVTDAREPMRNAVQIERIKFALDGYALLRRKLVITDLGAEGVRMNTPRKTSGALPKVAEPEPPSPGLFDDIELPKIELPAVKDLLATEELSSTKIGDQLRAELDQAKEQWTQRVAALPDAGTIKAYDDRINQAKPDLKGDLKQKADAIADSVKKLEAVRDDVRNDIAKIQEAKQAMQADWSTWSQHTKDLLAAPGKDFEQVKNKYSLDAKGATNASRALFGGQVASWTDTGLYWYDKLKPMLVSKDAEKEPEVKRFKGIDVKFMERDQLPGFLIRSAVLSLEVPAGAMKGEIRNITNDQTALGHPTTFSFFADKMRGVHNIEIEGAFNHVDPKAANDTAKMQVHGIQIDRMDVVRNKNFPITLSDADVDFQTNVELKGGALNADMSAVFKTVKLGVDTKDSSNELVGVFAAALADVQKFQIGATLTGTLKKYDVAIRSDLDNLLRDALNRQFRQRIDKFLADVKARLDEKVQDMKRQVDAKLGELKNIENTISQRRQQAEEALQKAEQELRATVEKQKAELESQRKALEDKAKQAIDEKKQQAQEKTKKEQDKLKQQLKDKLKL